MNDNELSSIFIYGVLIISFFLCVLPSINDYFSKKQANDHEVKMKELEIELEKAKHEK